MTNNLLDECKKTVEECRKLLFKKANLEWITRYEKYTKGIIKNEESIKKARASFYQVKPLYLYSGISKAYKSGNIVEYDLRFCGQSVASLKIKGDNVFITTQDKDKANKKYFTNSKEQSPNEIAEALWTSELAREFKNYFINNEKELSEKVKSPEHKIESYLLNLFEHSEIVQRITPVVIASAFFQMPTPFKASEKKKVSYSKSSGGGIDILARVAHGSNKDNRFAVMELKDENTKSEPQKYVLLQAIKYATFMAYLFRSQCGYEWYKILNPKTKAKTVPQELNIDVVSVMPKGEDDILEGDEFIELEDNVKLHLYSLFFDSEDINYFSGTFADVIKK